MPWKLALKRKLGNVWHAASACGETARCSYTIRLDSYHRAEAAAPVHDGYCCKRCLRLTGHRDQQPAGAES